jgi:threonine/homoserine/homoserine lactone efflux protein
MLFLIKAMILGFSLAAPVGPIGLLVINRTIRKGRLYGFISGLGATFADGVYGCIAGFGFGAITNFLMQHKDIIKPVGLVVMCLIGIKIFFSKTHFHQIDVKDPKNLKGINTILSKTHLHQINVRDSKNLIGAFTSVFFLTVSNPITILFFIALFSGLGLNIGDSYFSIFIFITGVLLGSATWWLILSSVTSIVRHKISEKTIGVINKVSGTALVMFAVFAYLKG